MARRAAKEAKEQGGPQIAPARPNVPLKKFIKIGRPGYKVTKQRDPATGQQSLLFQVTHLLSQKMLFDKLMLEIAIKIKR